MQMVTYDTPVTVSSCVDAGLRLVWLSSSGSAGGRLGSIGRRWPTRVGGAVRTRFSHGPAGSIYAWSPGLSGSVLAVVPRAALLPGRPGSVLAIVLWAALVPCCWGRSGSVLAAVARAASDSVAAHAVPLSAPPYSGER